MDKLEKYHKKRDFSNTREPKGGKSRQKSKKLRFVVQRHDARRRHFDLRLEMEGVLKSWAIPKEPSMNPDDKRLAVHVEDHPLEYASFEGEIPKGNYGAGTVEIYDDGYYEPGRGKTESDLLIDLKKGSLRFVLHGRRLKGEFSLVRMKSDKQKNWLLIKIRDDYQAGDSGQPGPMLAKLATIPPEEDHWVFEKKYDGFRALAISTNHGVRLDSRNGKILDRLFPTVLDHLTGSALIKKKRQFVLDGEIVIEDRKGRPNFQLLASGEPLPDHLYIRYYVFDLLELDAHDLRGYPLTDRLQLLALLLEQFADNDVVRPAERLTGSGKYIVDKATGQGWEGVIAKGEDSTYHPGRRSSQWLKIKFRRSQEAVICGFTEPQGVRTYFGALVLGYHDGYTWRYLGNCGTGFTNELLRELHDMMRKLVRKTKPFPEDTTVAKEKNVTWITPRLVCEVYFTEWTVGRHFRHPVFKGVRTDKKAKEIRIEKPDDSHVREKTVVLNRHKVKLTSLDKLYWPKEQYTKGQLIEHYLQFADRIIPFTKDRPISMHRFPDGIEEKGFYQKDVDVSQIPSWLHTVAIPSKSSSRDVDYVICNNAATLLYIANLGSIEINPWMSTHRKMEEPVFAVLDLDPNGVDMDILVEVAQTAHRLFGEVGIEDFIKTSGSTGLHIYIYLNQKYTYDIARDFIQLIAEMVHDEHPETTSLVRDPKKRKGKIYLDYLQNRRGQTVVAPYSVRPKPYAPVSTPLFWDEVRKGLKIVDHHILTIVDRVAHLDDPWAGIFDQPADLKQALAKL